MLFYCLIFEHYQSRSEFSSFFFLFNIISEMYSLRMSYMHTMNFDHTHPKLSLPTPPRSCNHVPLSTSQSLFKIEPVESKQSEPCLYGWEAIQWSKTNLPEAALLKKTDCPISRSHQVSIATQLGVGAHVPPHSCWKVS